MLNKFDEQSKAARKKFRDRVSVYIYKLGDMPFPFDLFNILDNTGKDDKLPVIDSQFQIIKMIHEKLAELKGRDNLDYNLDKMKDEKKINLLGKLGLDREILPPLKALHNLRNEFGHYKPKRKTILDDNDIKKLSSSLSFEDNKFFEAMHSSYEIPLHAGPKHKFDCFYTVLIYKLFWAIPTSRYR